MGVLPLQYMPGESTESLGLSGEETFSIHGIAKDLRPGAIVSVRATADDGSVRDFAACVRIDTEVELHYYEHGGILNYVLRRLARTPVESSPSTL
jgi:aconitate hydratase